MAQKVEEPFMMELLHAIVIADTPLVTALLATHPHLAQAGLRVGATRGDPNTYFFEQIKHHLYAGDTALHAAVAAHNIDIARTLLGMGADIGAKNRRGAEALHYASDSGTRTDSSNPEAQETIITFLIRSGANPNAVDKNGVTPLHRAVRTRSTNAVRALLAGGAEIGMKNENGSTPLHLAVQNTGRSGSGSPNAKAHQKDIIELLLRNGADAEDEDIHGKTVRHWIKEEWIKKLFSDL